MRKVIYLLILSSTLTSCTIEDVINYLNGQTNNLTEEQKKQVESSRSNYSSSDVNSMTTSNVVTIPTDTDLENDVERDKGGGRP